MRRLSGLILLTGVMSGVTFGQRLVQPLPKEALAAKTVAIVNNTHNEQVEEGAVEALKRWGKLTLIDDADVADITLTFDKKSEREAKSSQTTDKDGKPSSSYGVTFGSSVHMAATLKGASGSFYSATTSESKKKAGAECVLDLQQEYLRRP